MTFTVPMWLLIVLGVLLVLGVAAICVAVMFIRDMLVFLGAFGGAAAAALGVKTKK